MLWADYMESKCSPHQTWVHQYWFMWYSTHLYFILRSLNPDFFWAPATLLPPFVPTNVKTIVNSYDLVSKDYRDTMSFFNRLYSDLLFDRSIMQADILLAISNLPPMRLKPDTLADDQKNLSLAVVWTDHCLSHCIYPLLIVLQSLKSMAPLHPFYYLWVRLSLARTLISCFS